MTSPTTAITTAPNEVRRFIIENQPVRGYWVNLDSAWQDLRAHQHYSRPVQDLLGEAVSASVLLAATLKFEGTLTLQLEGKGDVRLLVAQCSNDFRVRAVARVSEDGDQADSAELDAEDDDEESELDEDTEEAGAAERPPVLAGVFDLGAAGGGADPFAALPKATELVSAASFRRLVGEEGRVVVTIEGNDSGMRYQGIVPLTGNSLAECLEAYF